MEFSYGRPPRPGRPRIHTPSFNTEGGDNQPIPQRESFRHHGADTATTGRYWLAAKEDSAYDPHWCRLPESIRDLSNPPCFGAPDQMSLYKDENGIHANGQIHSKAAYLLTEGGQFNGYDMKSGIGAGKATVLYFGVIFASGLVPGSDFMSARNAIVNWANYLATTGSDGITPLDACIVQNAYAAVGLGKGDDPNCDCIKDSVLLLDADKDGVFHSLDNCTTPNGGQHDLAGDGTGVACDDYLAGD